MSIESVTTGSILGKAVEGLTRATEKLNKAAQNIAEGNIDPADVVEMIQAETAVGANVAVARTADQTFKRLLDIKV
jgi:hypothetical protein